VFVFGIGIILVKEAVIFSGVKCHPDVWLIDAVFESGGIKLNDNVHFFNILLTAIGDQFLIFHHTTSMNTTP
jgi:hypothetical protein